MRELYGPDEAIKESNDAESLKSAVIYDEAAFEREQEALQKKEVEHLPHLREVYSKESGFQTGSLLPAIKAEYNDKNDISFIEEVPEDENDEAAADFETQHQKDLTQLWFSNVPFTLGPNQAPNVADLRADLLKPRTPQTPNIFDDVSS